MAQALLFINGDLINKKVSADGGLVDRLVKAGKSDDEILDSLYWTAFGRPPRPQERASDLAAIQRANPSATPAPVQSPTTASIDNRKSKVENPSPRRKAFEDMLWVLLNSKEFLFNH